MTGRRRDLLRALVELSLGRSLASVEATAVFAALDRAVSDNAVPTLPQVVAAMFEPTVGVAGSSPRQPAAAPPECQPDVLPLADHLERA